MATTTEQLDSTRQLSENWDGYGAARPQDHIIDLAREFVALIKVVVRKRSHGAVVHVSPTRSGGVIVEWEHGRMQHEVEINSDQSFAFLHLDKITGNIETRKLLAA